MRPWLLGAVALLLLPGCIDGPDGCVPPVSAAWAPADAPQRGGPGGDQVTIEVLDAATGAPMPAAAVAVVWNRDYIQPPEEADDDFPDEPPLDYVLLRTGDDGTAVAEIPEERYFMVTATADGRTEEALDLQSPGDGADAHLSVHLFPDRLVLAEQGEFGGAAMSPWAQGGFQPHPFAWGAIGGELAERIVSLDINLTWSLATGQLADLDLAAGPNEEDRITLAEGSFDPAAGTRRLAWHGGAEEAAQLIHGAGGLVLGPDAQGPVLVAGTRSITYEVQAEARFDARAVQADECGTMFPASETRLWTGAREAGAAAVAAGALALLGAAGWLRRRR